MEKFLTYAVNALGQHHLKQRVVVYVFGDRAVVRPNLRNALENLCKDIFLCDEEELMAHLAK